MFAIHVCVCARERESVCVCLIKGSVYHCRPGRPKPVTWWLKGNTVFRTIWSISCWAPDYLLDNHIKEDWEKGGGRQREKKTCEVKRPKRLKEEERKGGRLRTQDETKLEKKTGRGEVRRGPDNQQPSKSMLGDDRPQGGGGGPQGVFGSKCNNVLCRRKEKC